MRLQSDSESEPGARQPVDGMIAAHGLQQWWFEAFTDEERERIAARFQPEDAVYERPLTKGTQPHPSGSAAGLLNSLVGLFNNPGERDIARRIAEKTAALAEAAGDIPNLHFAYLAFINIHARDRLTNPSAVSALIDACKRQITLAPKMARIFGHPFNPLPTHLGYENLINVMEERGDYAEALRLAEEAKDHGWLGRWDERIARLRGAMLEGGTSSPAAADQL